MIRFKLGDLVWYDENRLMRVFAIGDTRSIYLRDVVEKPCPTCGRHPDISGGESAPILQDHVRPVDTIEVS